MLWLFHRRGEYLSCEVRTCLRNRGFEVVITQVARPTIVEWHPNELAVQRRWEQIELQLRREGWGEFSEWGSEERANWARVNGRGLPRIARRAAES